MAVLREEAIQRSLKLPSQGLPVHGGGDRCTQTGYLLKPRGAWMVVLDRLGLDESEDAWVGF